MSGAGFVNEFGLESATSWRWSDVSGSEVGGGGVTCAVVALDGFRRRFREGAGGCSCLFSEVWRRRARV